MALQESLLERIIREVPKSRHPSPFPKENLPVFSGPYFDIGRRAVEMLEDPTDIKEFMQQYTAHIQKKYHVQDRKKAEANAKDVVGYCTGYVDDRKANLWFDALPDITHPVTGRKRPFHVKADEFYVIATDISTKAIQYMKERFKELGSAYRVTQLEQKGDNAYIVFKLGLNDKVMIACDPTMTYLFLKGFITGLTSIIQKDFGESCNLQLEMISKKEKGN